jgi:hypothetical protein
MYTQARAAFCMLLAYIAFFLLELLEELHDIQSGNHEMKLFDHLGGFLLINAAAAYVVGQVCLYVIDWIWRLRVDLADLKAVGQIVKVEPSGLPANKLVRFWLTLEVDLNAGAPLPPRGSTYRAFPRQRVKEILHTRAIVCVPEELASTVRRGDWARMLLDPGDRKRALVEPEDLRAEPPA